MKIATCRDPCSTSDLGHCTIIRCKLRMCTDIDIPSISIEVSYERVSHLNQVLTHLARIWVTFTLSSGPSWCFSSNHSCPYFQSHLTSPASECDIPARRSWHRPLSQEPVKTSEKLASLASVDGPQFADFLPALQSKPQIGCSMPHGDSKRIREARCNGRHFHGRSAWRLR